MQQQLIIKLLPSEASSEGTIKEYISKQLFIRGYIRYNIYALTMEFYLDKKYKDFLAYKLEISQDITSK